jgi:hypothetical protein
LNVTSRWLLQNSGIGVDTTPVAITNGWQLVGYEITTRDLEINCTGPKVRGYTDTIERSRSQEILNSLFSTQIKF